MHTHDAQRRRRTVAVTAAALTVLAAGAAAATAAWMGGHPTRPEGTIPARSAARLAPHSLTPPPVPAPRPPTPPPATAVPQLPRVDLSGLRWTAYHGVELPSSMTAGPRLTGGGLASGFADTPLGALLAAINIAVRANAQWGPAVFVPTIQSQVTGPDAPALLASCQDAYDQARQAAGVPDGQPLGRAYVTEAAFRWDGYTPADATVDIVSAGPGGQGGTVQAATRIEVQWRGGDWRVVAPPGGDWGNAATLITSLDGYTSFPGPPA